MAVAIAPAASQPGLSSPVRAATWTDAVAMTTIDGAHITTAWAKITSDAGGWAAALRSLDRPGELARRYFSEGLREVVLRTGDGRQARARVLRTEFVCSGERLCEIIGLERLS